MNRQTFFSTFSRSVLGVAFAGCALVACTTQEAKPDSGSGGNSGGGGAGGSTGDPVKDGIYCKPPAQAITDFTYDADAGATDQVRWGTWGTTLVGGESVWANTPAELTSDVSKNDWHIMGNVANYAGFNLYFDKIEGCNKFDASAFGGITFTIWGTAAGKELTLGVGTVGNAVDHAWLAAQDAGSATPSPGRCTPTMGNQFWHPGCADPAHTFAVTGTQASPQTITVRWDAFTGGMPTPTVTPNEIISVYWVLPWMDAATAYAVDLHIDNLAFLPK